MIKAKVVVSDVNDKGELVVFGSIRTTMNTLPRVNESVVLNGEDFDRLNLTTDYLVVVNIVHRQPAHCSDRWEVDVMCVTVEGLDYIPK